MTVQRERSPGGPAAQPVVQAYGMQREICARAGLDSDGFPRRSPFDPVTAALRLSGPLSPDRLTEAITMVTAEVDVLRGRLRPGTDGYVFAAQPDAPGIPVSTVDLGGTPAKHQRHRLGHPWQHAVDLVADMRDGPAGAFVLARIGAEEHILLAAFDHGRIDQNGIQTLLSRIGAVYGLLAAGDPAGAESAARSPAAFFPYARTVQADADGRRSAELFWGPVVRDSPSRLTLPGRTWRSWRKRRSTEHLTWAMPAVDVRALHEARRVLGTSQLWLFLALLSVVLSGGTGAAFVPVTYLRPGRDTARPPIGPLWETCVTVAPGASDGRLASWITGFAAANTAAPALRGLALVDFAPLDVIMELRRFTVNVRLPERPLHFGDVRVSVLEPDRVPGLARPVARGTKHNLGIKLVPDPGRITLSLNYDPEDYAGEERLFTAVCQLARQLLADPSLPLDRARATALRVLAGGPSR